MNAHSRPSLKGMMQTLWPVPPKGDDESPLLAEVKTLDHLRGRAKIERISGYWDGPLSGTCSVDGESGYWFECCLMDGDSYDRLFVVYQMSEEQRRLKAERQAVFERFVVGPDGAKPKELHDGYYNHRFPDEPPLTKEQAMGWTMEEGFYR